MGIAACQLAVSALARDLHRDVCRHGGPISPLAILIASCNRASAAPNIVRTACENSPRSDHASQAAPVVHSARPRGCTRPPRHPLTPAESHSGLSQPTSIREAAGQLGESLAARHLHRGGVIAAGHPIAQLAMAIRACNQEEAEGARVGQLRQLPGWQLEAASCCASRSTWVGTSGPAD